MGIVAYNRSNFLDAAPKFSQVLNLEIALLLNGYPFLSKIARLEPGLVQNVDCLIGFGIVIDLAGENLFAELLIRPGKPLVGVDPKLQEISAIEALHGLIVPNHHLLAFTGEGVNAILGGTISKAIEHNITPIEFAESRTPKHARYAA